MSILLTSDIHLDSKPANEYRWQLFPFLESLIKEYNIDYLIITGDLTQEKDRHTAQLINRIVDNLCTLNNLPSLKKLLALYGNHDGFTNSSAFLKFINKIPKLQFITEPYNTTLNESKILFLPNSRQPQKDWERLIPTFKDYDLILCHQTFQGSIAENGSTLDGISYSCFENIKAKVYSGDIHRPATCGPITYIGSPYIVNFGSTFTPRIIILNNGQEKSIPTPFIKRHTLTVSNPKELESFELHKNDQIKVRLALNNTLDWDKYKEQINKFCAAKGVDLHGIEFYKENKEVISVEESKLKHMTPLQILEQYCVSSSVSEDLTKFGKLIIEKVG